VHWVKLAQDYYLDPRIRGLPDDVADAAEIMFIRGLARAGRVGMHGFIPEQDVELLTRRRRYEAVVKALVDSGLWTAVAGGYQVTRWSDWQEHLDALTRKRAADRERQRRRRAAARAATSGYTQPSTLSRDTSRDVAAGEGEEEKEQLHLGGKVTVPGSRDEPPRRCKKHLHDPDPPSCGGCKEARLAHEQWQQQRARQRVDAERRSRDAPMCHRCGNRTTSSYHQRICAREDTP